MSFERLKLRFGDRLCFHGGISIQKLMPVGSPEAIRREVRRIRDITGNSGGYIFCTAHNIQADTPVANIQALVEAYTERAGSA
jgi:uroporphyrinogen decarboxylase